MILLEDLLGLQKSGQHGRRFRNDGKGYACANFVLNNLQVTPESFLPEYMCACQPGFQGVGATCQARAAITGPHYWDIPVSYFIYHGSRTLGDQKLISAGPLSPFQTRPGQACPANTFAEKEGQRECEACPINSVSAKGSASLAACKCSYGHARGNEGNRSCQCEPHTAQLESHCLPCSKLHVVCREHGSVAQHAPVEQGYARLAGSVQVGVSQRDLRLPKFTEVATKGILLRCSAAWRQSAARALRTRAVRLEPCPAPKRSLHLFPHSSSPARRLCVVRQF